MVFGLFRTKSDDRPAAIYRWIVAAARQPVFYERFGVPDTVEGRIEMLMLQTGLVMSRLAAADGDRDLSRAVAEAFFADVDASLRELAVSDIAVPKKMKKVAGAFYGRLKAYEDAPDADALSVVLGRNLLAGSANPETPGLARWVRAAAASLRETEVADLVAGTATLPDPAAFLTREF
jgi:cytochrome b pre-mRNA-processing protein 3